MTSFPPCAHHQADLVVGVFSALPVASLELMFGHGTSELVTLA